MSSEAEHVYCRQDWPDDPRSETAYRLACEWFEKWPLDQDNAWDRGRHLARCVRAVEMHGRTDETAMCDIFAWVMIVGDVVRRMGEWLGKKEANDGH